MIKRDSPNYKLTWSALEYADKVRTMDWFWALGIIVVTGALAAVIFGDYFFAALLVIAGALIVFFAVKKPDMITYELNHRGLEIRNRLYPYENIKSFWVQADLSPLTSRAAGALPVPPILFIKTERVFLPIMSIPIHEDIAEDIHTIFTRENIPEEEMKEHPGEIIMELLGF